MKKRNFLTLVFSLAVLGLICYSVYIGYCKITTYNSKQSAFSSIGVQINDFLAKNKDGKTYLVVEDLEYPYTSFQSKEYAEIPAASIIKLPVLAVVLQAVEKGELSLDQIIEVKRRDITGGSGVIKAMKVPVSFRLDELLELMISRSDNTATNKVISLFDFDYFNREFKKLGLKSTILRRKMMDFSQRRRGIENYTSAADITFLLKQFYCEKIVGHQLSEFAIDLLKKQHVKDRLPRYLPEDIHIAHKTGLERGVVHDCGIVYLPSGDYTICVLTKGVSSYDKAKKYIAEISLITYNLYQARSSDYLWQKDCCERKGNN